MDAHANKNLWEPCILSEEFVHDMILECNKMKLDKSLKLVTKEDHQKSLKAPPSGEASSHGSSSRSSWDCDSSSNTDSATTVGDNTGENNGEENSREDNKDSEEKDHHQDPTPEEIDDANKAQPEDAGKEGRWRCFRCIHPFSSETCLSITKKLSLKSAIVSNVLFERKASNYNSPKQLTVCVTNKKLIRIIQKCILRKSDQVLEQIDYMFVAIHHQHP